MLSKKSSLSLFLVLLYILLVVHIDTFNQFTIWAIHSPMFYRYSLNFHAPPAFLVDTKKIGMISEKWWFQDWFGDHYGVVIISEAISPSQTTGSR